MKPLKSGKQSYIYNLPLIYIILIVVFFVWQTLHIKGGIFLEYFLLFSLPIVSFVIRKNKELRAQFFVIPLYILLLWGVGLFNDLIWHVNKLLILVGGVSSFVSCSIILGSILFDIFKNKKNIISYISIGVNNNKFIFFLEGLFITLSISTLHNFPFLDETSYFVFSYKVIHAFNYMFDEIKNFAFADHIAYGYSIPILLAETISYKTAVSEHWLNIILVVISSVLLYKALLIVYKDKPKKDIYLITTIYTISPFVLGVVGLLSLDNITLYYFIILIAAYILKYRIIELLAVFLLLYTKEPSIVYYAFLCIGILVAEIVTDKDNDDNVFLKIWKKILFYLPEVIMPILWVITFVGQSATGWNNNMSDNNHYFGFTFTNFIQKIKQIFVYNFNWIITVIICIFLICLAISLVTKKKIVEKNIVTERIVYRTILIFSFVGMLFFNLIYIDFPTIRYVIVASVTLLLIGLDCLVEIKKSIAKYVTFISIAVVLFIQSFVSIDPVSYFLAVPVTKYGNNLMINSATNNITDDSVYNREYTYYMKAINKVLKDMDISEGDIICFYSTPYVYPYMYWDTEKEMLVTKESENAFWVEQISYQNIDDARKNREGDVLIITNVEDRGDFKDCHEASYMTVSVCGFRVGL